MNSGELRELDRHGQIICKECGYSLAHNRTGRCPECGGRFDLRDPWTYATPRLRAERDLANLNRAHAMFFVSLAALAIVPCVFGGEIALTLAALFCVPCAAALLIFQGIASHRAFGVTYAVAHLLLAIALTPMALLGLAVIPYLVILDLRRVA